MIPPDRASQDAPDIKILASHPVQYHVPLFRALQEAGQVIDVAYYHQGTAGRRALDAEFGIEIEWKIDLLGGYPNRVFLPADRVATYTLTQQLQLVGPMLKWALHSPRTPLLLVGWSFHIVWVVWLIRILLGLPVLVLAETNLTTYTLSPKPAWRTAFLKWLMRRTSAGLVIGSRSREFWLAMGVSENRLFSAPYSVDNNFFETQSQTLRNQRAQLCTGYGLDAHRPTFLFCGKLIPVKRPLALLRAYHEAGLDSRAQLLYVGDGALRAELAAYASEHKLHHVVFAGFLNLPDLPLAYLLGEILCLMSVETWGLVVNEALACGRPVIVSEMVGCAPDLVRPDNGWIVPLDDHNALVAALKTALDNYDNWPDMGQRGVALVRGHTYQSMTAGILAALKCIKTGGSE